MKKLQQLQETAKDMIKAGYSDAYIEACLYSSFNDVASIKTITDIIATIKNKQIIIFASTVKEAKEIAIKEYSGKAKYVEPYKYTRGKGNNFYEFGLIK